MAKYDVNIRDYWRVIRKRKAIIILVTFLISSSSFLFAKFRAPVPQFEAVAAIKFERSTSLTGLFLEAITYYTADILATQSVIITCFPIMEKAAKELGLIDPELSSDQIRQSEELSAVIAQLQRQVKAEQVEDTNVINITATVPHPKVAQRLANTVAKVYREQNIAERNRQTKQARIFIEQRLRVVGHSLKKAEERLKNYKEQKELVALDQQVAGIVAKIADLESSYEKANRSIEVLSLELSKLERGIKHPSTSPPVFPEDLSPAIAKLNATLQDLITKRDALLINYTKKSPQVQQIEGQIEKLKVDMERTLSSKLKSLKEQQEILKNNIQIAREMYKNVPEEHLELLRLEREVKLNEELFSLLKSKHQEALIKEAEQIEEVTIVKPALLPTKPINPPRALAIALVGIILGSMLGLVFAFISETLDTSIGAIEDVEEFLGIPVLGVIPFMGIEDVKNTIADLFPEVKDEDTLRRYARLVTHFAPKIPLTESYRTLRTNVEFTVLTKGAKTIVFTSSSPLEGKTTITINLAIAMAQAGKKTLLVESDLRRPVISRIFGIKHEPGITDMLLGNYEWTEVTKTITDIMMGKMKMEEVMLTPGMDNLNIISSGPLPPNPAEVVGSSRMKDFINQAREKYDIVLLDSAPALTAADAAVLGSWADGTIIVYQVGRIARGALRRTKAQLEGVKAKAMGVVLNAIKPELSPDFEALKYDKYYYGEKKPRRISKWLETIPQWLETIPQSLQKAWETLIRKGREKKEWAENQIKKISWFRIIILILALAFLVAGIVWQQHVRKKVQVPAPVEIEKAPPPAPSTTETKKEVGEKPPPQISHKAKEALSKTPIIQEKGVSPAHYPYSIHISSFPTHKLALDNLKELQQGGHKGYLSFVDLGNKGKWYRVFIGPFEDQNAANEYLRNLKGFSGARVLLTPFTLELGRFRSQKEAIEEQKKLTKKGYMSSYILPAQLPDKNGEGFKLLIGAFCTKEGAETFLQTLEKDGLEAQVVVR